MMKLGLFTVLCICVVGVRSQDGYCDFVRQKNCDKDPKEAVCGTDGVTYENRCAFAKVYCTNKRLHLQSVGACPGSATTKPTTMKTTPKPTTKTTTPAPTTQPSTRPTTPQPTQAPVTTVKVTLPTTTMKPINGSVIALDIFCLDLNYIRCPVGGTQVCGSDGKFYENMCEFDKQRCFHRDLHPRNSGCV